MGFLSFFGGADRRFSFSPMADEEDSEELVMIAEKARTLLTRGERQMLSQCCTSYLSGQTGVRAFADALLRLLPTPDKVSRRFNNSRFGLYNGKQ